MLTGLLLLAAAGYAVFRLALGYPRAAVRYAHLTDREVAILEAAAEAMFPDGGAIPLAGREADVPGYVDRYFATLHAGKRRQIRLLLTLVEQATIFFPASGWSGFRRFTALDPEQQVEVLRGWCDSPWFLRRTVFTALRAVLTMGYLGHPVALRRLGLAPYAIDSPVVTADCLYPPIGRPPSEIRHAPEARTATSAGDPLPLDGPLHPDFAAAERGRES